MGVERVDHLPRWPAAESDVSIAGRLDEHVSGMGPDDVVGLGVFFVRLDDFLGPDINYGEYVFLHSVNILHTYIRIVGSTLDPTMMCSPFGR